MSLIVTGTIGIDSVRTPHQQRDNVLGGSCTYFAAGASFHGPVRVVAAVGDDFPNQFRDALGRYPGIDLAGLEVRAGAKTFRWGGRYAQNMNSRETLFTELGVLTEAPPAIPPPFRDSRYVFLANTHPSVQLQLLEQLPRRTMAVADTMDLWIRTARADLTRLLSRTDGLVLNYDEAELLTGKANAIAAARSILGTGPTFVIVKKGEHGSVLVHREGLGAMPAYPTENVVDPTGAGDCFAGGLMGYIAATAAHDNSARSWSFQTIRAALAHGTVISSFVIESFGLDRLASLTSEELSERQAEFASMLRF